MDNFQEARRRYDELKSELDAGNISPATFDEAVAALRFPDSSGTWWRIDPRSGRFNPEKSKNRHGASRSCPACRKQVPAGIRFCTSCGTPVPRHGGRPRATGSDCPSCGAGGQTRAFCTCCGAKMPQAQQSGPSAKSRGFPVCASCGARVSSAEYCTACGARLEKQTETASSPGSAGRGEAGSRFLKWNQRVWDVLSMAGCGTMALVFYGYTKMSRLANQAEAGPDMSTPLAMVALPIGLIVFRKTIDRLLMPLQQIRRRIPPMFLLGAGLASPFLVSNLFYYVIFGVERVGGTDKYALPSGTEYPCLLGTFVTSVLVSYVILRNPVRKQD